MTASRYAQIAGTRQTPQTEPIPGKIVVPNSAGGYSFPVDKWMQLHRFISLGCAGGSYYATEQKLTKESAAVVRECALEDPVRTGVAVKELTDRAPKPGPGIFALALMSGMGGKAAEVAHSLLCDVCRTPTHLFQFVASVEQFRGWGRSLKRAVAGWYERDPRDLAYLVSKYQQRDGWSHRDVLRLTKPKLSPELSAVARWAVGREVDLSSMPAPIVAFEQAKKATSAKEIVALIRDQALVRECIPTQFLNSPEVWEALLEKMPLTAMVRNLGKMSSVGLTKPLSSASATVCERLRNQEWLNKAHVHPLSILTAQRIYGQGRGMKGGLTWTVDQSIVDALDDAFYLAFHAIKPAGKRFLLGLDVSGSMEGGNVAESPLTPREAAAAMALVTMKTEPRTHVMAFSGNFIPIDISPKSRLSDAIRVTSRLPFSATDCALPMLYALQNQIEVDTFVVYTDSETWFGRIHPVQALEQYRQKMGIGAKLVVVGLVANKFTIADPADGGMLDVVGFDSAAPGVISDFARGE